eukprot:TRINITY_DN12192_c0_g1_i5.p1 TRINITY_DN12192_c0_g1~~TRINITY_DN12192_c0_g1_i5.p1  ORF type:complete len:232 (+),score=64.77 TRINITY_DN12192_c0_g1_i5:36-731(+)
MLVPLTVPPPGTTNYPVGAPSPKSLPPMSMTVPTTTEQSRPATPSTRTPRAPGSMHATLTNIAGALFTTPTPPTPATASAPVTAEDYLMQVYRTFEEINSAVTVADIPIMLRILGHLPDEFVLKDIYRANSLQGFAPVDFYKFTIIVQQYIERKGRDTQQKAEELKFALMIFNKDNKGKVWLSDMTNVFKVVGDIFNTEELEMVSKRLAPYTKDGYVLFTDLCNLLAEIYV